MRVGTLTEALLHLFCHTLLLCKEASRPKIINNKKYLNTNNVTGNNRHFVFKSSQVPQLYITKVFYKQFSCSGYINHSSSEILIKLTFSDSVKSQVTNIEKINNF